MTDEQALAIKHQIESLIDEHGIKVVLEMVQIICLGKAMHLRTSWNDDRNAEFWDDIGDAINEALGNC